MDRRAIRDIDVMPDGRLLAVGDAGLVAYWSDGRWTARTVDAPERNDALTEVVVPTYGPPLARSGSGVLREDARGVWRRVTTIGRHGDGRPSVTSLDSGWIAVAVRDTVERSGWVLLRGDDAPSEGSLTPTGRYSRPFGAVPQAVHGLPGNRLVVAWSVPEDPMVPGWLEVWGPPYNWVVEEGDTLVLAEPERVDLPATTRVTHLLADGEYLYVVGTRMFGWKIPLDSLLGAEEAGRN